MSDMITADGFIDLKEMESLKIMMLKYGIEKSDVVDSKSITLSQAVKVLQRKQSVLNQLFLDDLYSLAVSDKNCTREEALLLSSLTYFFVDNKDIQANIVSVPSSEIDFPNNQILYFENDFAFGTNSIILEHYREIVIELRLVGFDFVYIPKIVDSYRRLDDKHFCEILFFLYPQTSEDVQQVAIQQLKGLTTSLFCRSLFSSETTKKEINEMPSSIMVKIGNSKYDNKLYSNYLFLELGDDVLNTVLGFVRIFNAFSENVVLDYLQERAGRFVFKGLYRQLLDFIMVRKGIRSNVLIDTNIGEIVFPESGVKIENLHRKEKALYALFLVESWKGGINFTKPLTIKQFERHERSLRKLQKKYNLIYEKFGGDREKAPHLDDEKIRLPMISLIKRQISKLSDVLYPVDDYIISRNMYGIYGVKVPVEKCLCMDFGEKQAKPIKESAFWQRIMGM